MSEFFFHKLMAAASVPEKSSTGPRPICILRGHEGVVTALHFTNEKDDGITDSPSLISGSDCGEIFIWSLKTQRTYHKFKGHNGKMILYLCYHKSSLLSQGRDGRINVWSFINNEWNILKSFSSSSYGFCSASLFLTESRTYLVSPTGEQSSITFYDFDTSAVLNTYRHKESKSNSDFKTMTEMCMCAKVLIKDSKIYLLLGYDSGFLSLWDYETNAEKSRLKCHPEVILCLDFDAKHRNRGISGSVDNTLQVWKINDSYQLVKVQETTIKNPGINAVKIRSDGKIVITAGQDRYIRVFSWKSLRPLVILVWHKKPVFSLAWSTEPFGKHNLLFASGSKDKNICVASIY